MIKLHYFCITLTMIFVAGCSTEPQVWEWDIGPPPIVSTTKKDDSTSCMYWKCSTNKKLYLQKYVKDSSGIYRSAGAFPLDKGIGAFPLKDIDKNNSDSEVLISIADNGYGSCPYCSNESMGRCSCKRMHCLPITSASEITTATCPWCSKEGNYQPGKIEDTGGAG